MLELLRLCFWMYWTQRIATNWRHYITNQIGHPHNRDKEMTWLQILVGVQSNALLLQFASTNSGTNRTILLPSLYSSTSE